MDNLENWGMLCRHTRQLLGHYPQIKQTNKFDPRILALEDDPLHSAQKEAPILGSNPAASTYIDSGFSDHLLLDANTLASKSKRPPKPESK